DDGAYRRAARSHRGDHVADPVDEIQERSFRLRSGLTLDGHVGLRGGTEVLGQSVVRKQEQRDPRNRQGPLQAGGPRGSIGHSIPPFWLGREATRRPNSSCVCGKKFFSSNAGQELASDRYTINKSSQPST